MLIAANSKVRDMSGIWRDFVEVPGHLLYFGDNAKFNHYMVSLLSPLQVTRLEAVFAKMVELEASQDPYMLQVGIDWSHRNTSIID